MFLHPAKQPGLSTVLFSSVAVAASAAGPTRAPAADASVIRVSAEGTASAVPDQAIVQVGIATHGGSAQQAAAENARKQDAVVRALKAALEPAGRVETFAYNVQPRYGPPQEGAPPSVSGYEAQNSLRVTVADPKDVGRSIDTALQAGATTIEGVTFALKDEEPVRAQALKAAVRRANSEARVVAAGLGLDIVRIASVEEGPLLPPHPVLERGAPRPERAEVPATTVVPGSLQFQSEVVLTVEVAAPRR